MTLTILLLLLSGGTIMSQAEWDPTAVPVFQEMWDYGHPSESEVRFRAIEATVREHHPALFAELITQIARAEGLQSKFADAGTTLARVRALGDAISPRARIRYELEWGRMLNSSGEGEKSRIHFERALALAEESADEFFAIDAAHMMGIVAPSEEQLAWNERALAMASASDNPVARKWIGSLYNNIGYTYLEQGEYELALVNFRKLEQFCAETDNPSFGAVARWFIGKTYRLQGRTEEALAMQQKLLAAEEAKGEAGAFTLEEVAECHLALGAEEQARRHFLLTHEALYSDEQYQWVLDSDKERVIRIRKLAGLPD